MTAKTLMIQGTTSHSGKTLCVAALCWILRQAGYRVAPFKAQNMSLNSYVTADGGEIARAQALQAFAAGIEPTADMNPILIKPKGDMTSQVMLFGKPYRDVTVSDYYDSFSLRLGLKAVEEALTRLRSRHDIVVIEGAGSPVEINLYNRDIANMRVAELADAPVIIVGDIDRGGVFASLLGTYRLLKPEHRRRVRGFIINKLRGEASILKPGIERLTKLTRVPVLGIVPHAENLQLPTEDSLGLNDNQTSHGGSAIDVAVVRFPHISNFTDFDPLGWMQGVAIRFVNKPETLRRPDLLILPGTKNAVSDLLWLRGSGLADSILHLHEEGTPIIGICGGFQMLGRTLNDDKGYEGGSPANYEGLGILDVETFFDSHSKVTERVTARVTVDKGLLKPATGETFNGYMIHMGRSVRAPNVQPAFNILNSPSHHEGAVDAEGLTVGTYVHGLFDDPPLRHAVEAFLGGASRPRRDGTTATSSSRVWEENLETFASIFTRNVNMQEIFRLLGLERTVGG